MVEVAAHEEGRGSHDKVQHLPRQDGHERVLPLQGVQVDQEALGHQRQQGPVGGKEHGALLRQEARQDLQRLLRSEAQQGQVEVQVDDWALGVRA